MSTCTTRLRWQRGDQRFTDRRYSRTHRLRFDGGAELAGSSSPAVVPEPGSDPAAVDPEEMFVAALSSCHMLWFLDLACRAGWCVDDYQDEAEGWLGKDAGGRVAMTCVTLRPQVRFRGTAPDATALQALHRQAHAACFVANSVRSEVRCEPLMATGPEGAPT
jgi:organic hydroperoxide reductase OsmC/OhrA